MLDERLDEALKIFLVLAELWPESYISWDSLGKAYMRLGQKAKAIESFEKSLKLNPENQNAIQHLAQLKGYGSIRIFSLVVTGCYNRSGIEH